jgi:hypothetical protein
MSYQTLSDAELFETRRRIIFLGIDHCGNRAGERQSIEIVNLMQSRCLILPEAVEAYDRGMRAVSHASTPDLFREACRYFKRAVEISPRFLNAHANLVGALCNIGSYREAVQAADLGRRYGFFFDLEYNRAKALLLTGSRPSDYRSELVALFRAVDQCMRHGGAIEQFMIEIDSGLMPTGSRRGYGWSADTLATLRG